MNPILVAARKYVERGFSVIPVNTIDHPHPKWPALKTWKRFQLNPPDDETMKQWWHDKSKLRLGLVTGPVSNEIAVLDIDNLELVKRVLEDEEWSEGRRIVQTPSGGIHIYFREHIAGGLRHFDGVGDIRAAGGYVVAPPSEGYKLIQAGSMPWVDSLEEYVEEEFFPYFDIDYEKKTPGGTLPDEITEGARNDTLFRFAALMRGGRATEEEILAALRVANRDRCKPPLDDEDVERIAQSASRYEANRAELSEKPTAPEIGRALHGIHRIGVIGGAKGQLAVYDEGVYRIGDAKIYETAADLLGDKYSPQRVDGAVRWLSETTETPRIPDTPERKRLNVKNGILDLETMELDIHSSEYLSTVQIPVVYDPKARCPVIDKFLHDVLPKDLVPVFYEVAGWLMVPDTTRKTAVLFLGETDTGKSTAIELLQFFLGSANFSSVSLQDLSSTFRPAELVGKLANFFDDLSNSTLKDSGTFKALTGRGNITVERKFSKPYSVAPFARLLFAANEPPRTWDTTSAYFNRWLVFPFDRQIPKSKQDRELSAKLSAESELSGFLNKALQGLKRGKFSVARSAERAGQRFREESDPIATFLDERYEHDPKGTIRQKAVYFAYQSWCASNHRTPVPVRKFYQGVRELELYDLVEVKRDGYPYWRGLSVKKG